VSVYSLQVVAAVFFKGAPRHVVILPTSVPTCEQILTNTSKQNTPQIHCS